MAKKKPADKKKQPSKSGVVDTVKKYPLLIPEWGLISFMAAPDDERVDVCAKYIIGNADILNHPYMKEAATIVLFIHEPTPKGLPVFKFEQLAGMFKKNPATLDLAYKSIIKYFSVEVKEINDRMNKIFN